MKHLLGVRYSRFLVLILALIPGILIGVKCERSHETQKINLESSWPCQSRRINLTSRR